MSASITSVQWNDGNKRPLNIYNVVVSMLQGRGAKRQVWSG